MLKICKYDGKYRLASFARKPETLYEMQNRRYEIVYQKNEMLTFYPEKRQIKLERDEIFAFEQIGEYSILEFSEEGCYIYYDSLRTDNALFITNKCNSNCIMCPTSDTIRKNSEITPIDNLLKICSQIPNDTEHITITGGEPFLLKKNIFQLFNYLKNNLNSVEYLLLTNGRVFSDAEYFRLFCETVPDNLIIGIPLHGYDERTHDFITRSTNSFIQTLHGIKRLLSRHIRVELRIVVSKLNIEFIDKIANLIIDELKGIYSVKFLGLEMLGNARHNMDQVWIDYQSSFEYLKLPIRKLVINEFNVGVYNYPLCCVDKSYWAMCEKSITDYKIRFLKECNECRKRDACGGMFKGTFRLMKGKIKAIL